MQTTPQSRPSGIIPAALSLFCLFLASVDVKPSTATRVYYACVIFACVCLVLIVWRRAGVSFRWITTILPVGGIAMCIDFLST